MAESGLHSIRYFICSYFILSLRLSTIYGVKHLLRNQCGPVAEIWFSVSLATSICEDLFCGWKLGNWELQSCSKHIYSGVKCCKVHGFLKIYMKDWILSFLVISLENRKILVCEEHIKQLYKHLAYISMYIWAIYVHDWYDSLILSFYICCSKKSS